MSPPPSSSLPSASTSPLPLFSRFSDQVSVSQSVTETRKPHRAIDIAVAGGIVSLLIALILPTLNSRDIRLPTVTRGLVDHLRLARAGAARRETHLRVTFHTNAYAIEQLQDSDGDGIWEPDGKVPAWHVFLPPTIMIGVTVDSTVEFDARGLVSAASQNGAATPVTVKLTDSQTKQSTVIEILPSGKVQRL